MTDTEKYKLIVEALGECWHEWECRNERHWNTLSCSKCGLESTDLILQFCTIPYNLSTWEGFGWWWERAQKQEWWMEFIDNVCNGSLFWADGVQDLLNIIHPTRGRDALYEFLAGRKK